MYLVSYDIESDRLRKKISDTLENYGIRIQYSVFECEISEQRYKNVPGINASDGTIRG